jgi:hypothetical protein
MYSFIYFFAVLGFEVRASHLLGRYSTTWATRSPFSFLFVCFSYFSNWVPYFCLGLALGPWSSYLCLLCSWDYSDEPLVPLRKKHFCMLLLCPRYPVGSGVVRTSNMRWGLHLHEYSRLVKESGISQVIRLIHSCFPVVLGGMLTAGDLRTWGQRRLCQWDGSSLRPNGW